MRLFFVLLLSLSLACIGYARPHYRIHVFKCYANKNHLPRITFTRYGYTITGYGYDILNGGKPFIHQASVPAISGNEPFKTRKQAKRVARLVRKKLKQGIMPPTVSIAELQALGIIGK